MSATVEILCIVIILLLLALLAVVLFKKPQLDTTQLDKIEEISQQSKG